MPFSPAAAPSIFTLLMKNLIQLEETYLGALLLYLILPSLEKALIAHVLVTMTKEITHITIYLLDTLSTTSFVLQGWFYHCNCIYIKGFHWQSYTRQ